MTNGTRAGMQERETVTTNISKENKSQKQKMQDEILEAVQMDGSALKNIRQELQTPEICLTAVKQNGMALKYVKEQTIEICLAAAVKKNSYALRYVMLCIKLPKFVYKQ